MGRKPKQQKPHERGVTGAKTHETAKPHSASKKAGGETKGRTKKGASQDKHEKGGHAHLPLHEQIKRKLSERVKKEKKGHEASEKKSAVAGKKGHVESPVSLGAKTHPKASRAKEADTGTFGPEPLELSSFERKMMTRLEIAEEKNGAKIRVIGGLGVSKTTQVGKDDVPRMLESILPKKINSMDPGEEFSIVGMEMSELDEFFGRDIVVEPKGELEVEEREEDDRITIVIRVSEPEKPLFNYSSPGVEDVRRLVEREKLRILASGMNSQESSSESGNDDSGNWLKDQLSSQKKDIVALAREMGDLVKKPEKNEGSSIKEVISIQPKEEVKVETVSNFSPKAPEAPELGAPKAELQPPTAPEQVPPKAPPGAQSSNAPTQPQAQLPSQPQAPAATEAQAQDGSINMAEFMDAYKEEAVTYVEALKKHPQLKDNPKNADLISEIHRSAHSLKSMSAAMGFLNISKISKALEILFASYKKSGAVDMGKYDTAQEAIDRINSLYSDLANSEKANVDEVVKKVESITPN